jgi:hypothetical protein
MHCGNSDDVVESPCINVCKIENDVCIGCGRTLEEIAHWLEMTDADKEQVNANLQNKIQ